MTAIHYSSEKEKMNSILGLLLKVVGAVSDPNTGKMSLSRAAGSALLTLGAPELAELANQATTLAQVAPSAVLTVAGTALILARTKAK
jgi:hypothetical protein